MPTLTNEEVIGLEEMRTLIEEFIEKDEEVLVQQFFKNVDEEFMLQFLRGRKYRPKHAFDTLKRHAEVKLVKYPEMFPEVLPEGPASLQHCPVVTVLKSRDKEGRRILTFDAARWDVDKHSFIDLAMFGVRIMENLMRDEDAINNGIVLVQDCSALGIKHCLQYSVKTIRQLITIFWHAYPVRYKALYFVNTPYMLSCALSLARFFFPKKLKERLHIWSTDRGYEDLHQHISTDILPKATGGTLEYDEAIDHRMAVVLG